MRRRVGDAAQTPFTVSTDWTEFGDGHGHQGLNATDWIVLNPADSLDDGVQVNVKEISQIAAPGQPASGPAGASPQPGAKKN